MISKIKKLRIYLYYYPGLFYYEIATTHYIISQLYLLYLLHDVIVQISSAALVKKIAITQNRS